jgi:hypothetical protein
MKIAHIELSRLRLNPFNDRHGPLKDEASSIQWLLDNRKAHMRALSQDLAKTRRLYERPLVRPEGDGFVVFDGNRRTCCMKLLINPQLAPSEAWVEFYSELNSPEVDQAFRQVECEVEQDIEVIDETLLRRHTGSQEGVGQSPWDPEGKSFFLQRTGKASVGLGESIERALKAEQLIPADLSLPWSNLERLFSSEPIRKRAGFSFSGGELTYLTDKQKNLATLQRVANDLAGQGKKKVVLNDLWNNAKKGQYLDQLKSEGVMIDAVTIRPADPDAQEPLTSPTSPPPRTTKGSAPKDKHVISSADQNPFMDHPGSERAQNIWRELQFSLQFDQHDNAIAVLMRVLLELAIIHYAREHGLVFGPSDFFARRVSSVADSMLNRGLIDQRARAIIRKFESDKPIVSAHSMHQYVHNPDYHPARSDLKAIWTVIRAVVINSVR